MWSVKILPRDSDARRSCAPSFSRTCEEAAPVASVFPLKIVAFPAELESLTVMLPCDIATPIPTVAAVRSPRPETAQIKPALKPTERMNPPNEVLQRLIYHSHNGQKRLAKSSRKPRK